MFSKFLRWVPGPPEQPTVRFYDKKPINLAQSLEDVLKSEKNRGNSRGKNFENRRKFEETNSLSRVLCLIYVCCLILACCSFCSVDVCKFVTVGSLAKCFAGGKSPEQKKYENI